MPAKRPSYPSIRARQRNILEYMYSTNETYRQAAREFGTTPRDLERFVTTRPKSLRQQYNRSPHIRNLYQIGERKSLSAKAKTHGERLERIRAEYGYRETIRTVPSFDREYAQRLGRTQAQIAFLYQSEYSRDMGVVWAQYAAHKNIPTSIKTLKLMYRNGRFSRDEYDEIVSAWRIIYKIDTAQVA